MAEIYAGENQPGGDGRGQAQAGRGDGKERRKASPQGGSVQAAEQEGEERVHLDDQALEVVQQIWARRAEQLARVPTQVEEGAQVEMILVRLGSEVYGLDVETVQTIRMAEQITRVPMTPEWMPGVVNLRGRILSVIDLEGFFGLPQDAAAGKPARYLVVAETPLMELAFLVDEVLAVEPFLASRIQETTNMIRGIKAEYVVGVIEREGRNGSSEESLTAKANPGQDEMIIVLDLPAVLSDPRLIVNHENV